MSENWTPCECLIPREDFYSYPPYVEGVTWGTVFDGPEEEDFLPGFPFGFWAALECPDCGGTGKKKV